MNYRFKALEQRRQPDRLDSPTILASPRGWVAVFVVLITAVLLAFWGAFGNIARTLQVDGLLAQPGGIHEVSAPVTATIKSIAESGSSSVERGATLAVLTAPDGSSVRLPSPVSGRVVSHLAVAGDVVQAGTPLLQLEEVTSPEVPLEVYLFVDAEQVPTIAPGQTVTLDVPGVSARVFGRLRGEVASVDRYPLTDSELARFTGGRQLRQADYSLGVGPRLVTVQLRRDADSSSGYAWTSAGGPPVRLTSRTPVEAEIAIGTISPFSMLIGD